MSGVDFAASSLRGTTFRKCNLERAKFDGADLYDVFFYECNLKSASFRNATALLSDALELHLDRQLSLACSDVQGAVFAGADMDCSFSECSGVANLEGATIGPTSHLGRGPRFGVFPQYVGVYRNRESVGE